MGTTPETYYVSEVAACDFVLRLLSVCGVCSSSQAASVYAYRDRPVRRIWAVLERLRGDGYIESRKHTDGQQSVHRLTRKVRQKHGLRPIRWDARIEHKLAITDLYLTLGQPEYFIREYRQRFMWLNKERILSPDACAMVGDDVFLYEVQRTPIETRKWVQKRKAYEQYFASGAWTDVFAVKPRVVVVQYANQQLDTIGPGLGYDLTVCNGMEEVGRIGPNLDVWAQSRQRAGKGVHVTGAKDDTR